MKWCLAWHQTRLAMKLRWRFLQWLCVCPLLLPVKKIVAALGLIRLDRKSSAKWNQNTILLYQIDVYRTLPHYLVDGTVVHHGIPFRVVPCRIIPRSATRCCVLPFYTILRHPVRFDSTSHHNALVYHIFTNTTECGFLILTPPRNKKGPLTPFKFPEAPDVRMPSTSVHKLTTYSNALLRDSY